MLWSDKHTWNSSSLLHRLRALITAQTPEQSLLLLTEVSWIAMPPGTGRQQQLERCTRRHRHIGWLRRCTNCRALTRRQTCGCHRSAAVRTWFAGRTRLVLVITAIWRCRLTVILLAASPTAAFFVSHSRFHVGHVAVDEYAATYGLRRRLPQLFGTHHESCHVLRWLKTHCSSAWRTRSAAAATRSRRVNVIAASTSNSNVHSGRKVTSSLTLTDGCRPDTNRTCLHRFLVLPSFDLCEYRTVTTLIAIVIITGVDIGHGLHSLHITADQCWQMCHWTNRKQHKWRHFIHSDSRSAAVKVTQAWLTLWLTVWWFRCNNRTNIADVTCLFHTWVCY